MSKKVEKFLTIYIITFRISRSSIDSECYVYRMPIFIKIRNFSYVKSTLGIFAEFQIKNITFLPKGVLKGKNKSGAQGNPAQNQPVNGVFIDDN